MPWVTILSSDDVQTSSEIVSFSFSNHPILFIALIIFVLVIYISLFRDQGGN